jgi:hypothetical protein
MVPATIDEASRVLRTAPAKTASPQPMLSNGPLGFVYLYAGAPERALDYYQRFAEAGYPLPINGDAAIWATAYAPVRKTEAFRVYVRKAGFVVYWKAKGWPDLCHPMAGDDFACD